MLYGRPASDDNMELKEVGDQVFAAECILKSRIRKVGFAMPAAALRVHGVLRCRLDAHSQRRPVPSADVEATTADLT